VPASDRVAEFVEPYLKAKQIPGCAVMVRYEGKPVLCAGYGIANLEHRVRVTPETVFQSGSIGKQFTAMGVMLLAKEGKLALTDPISKYLSVPETWKGITIRHLLNHTSGLGDYPEDFSLIRDYTEEELLRMVTAQPLAAAPGDKWNYSNLGYVTLGILIHKVTGKLYGDFLSQRIFQPLGMTSSRVINESDIIPHRAAGYRLREGVLKNQDWVAPSINTTADGSLYLTAQDMAKWAECLDEEKLLDHAGYEEMWAPATLNDGATAPYGYGWSIGKTPSGHRVLEHGGAWQGFASYIARYPDERLTVAVFCNRAGASARYIAQRVAALSVPELAPLARLRAKSTPESLRQYAGQYRMEDRFTIVVEAEADHLETTWLGERILMIPESDTAFFEQDSDRTFRFVKDERGNVTALKIFVPEELTLRRLGSVKRK
jgi:CubicO group peptidase (beta-lactamase class C family)